MTNHFLIPVLLFLLPHCGWTLTSRDVWIPQARTLAPSDVRFDLQNQFVVAKKSNDPLDTQSRSLWGLSVGVMEQLGVALEASLDWIEPSPEEAIAAIAAGLRLRALDLEKDGFAFAVGIDRLGFKAGVSDINLIYALFQNRIGEQWESLFGAYVGNTALLVDDEGRADARGIYFGLWRWFDSKQGKFGVEYQSGRNQLGYLMPGLQLHLRQDLFGYVGYGLANNRAGFRDYGLIRLGVDF